MRPIFSAKAPATKGLSPVMIFTWTPSFLAWSMADLLVGFNGSLKAKQPTKVRCFSSSET